ncbi:hypothetical protein BKA64DRAFT_771598 [Cadophora sp. MPI-SDFR-AT-0126]|nr:hypothetical protein BKA64DRAFT_771598 [Leotiomycetes sp. MPI-SDFR-AT-0126]
MDTGWESRAGGIWLWRIYVWLTACLPRKLLRTTCSLSTSGCDHHSSSRGIPPPYNTPCQIPATKPEILAGGTLGLTHWVPTASIPNSRNYTDTVLLGFWDIWEKNTADIRLELSTSTCTDKGTVAKSSAWAGTSEYSIGATYLKVSCTASQVFGMDWGTHQIDMNPDPLLGTVNYRIRFFREYVYPPVVVVWLNRLDMSSSTKWGVNVTTLARLHHGLHAERQYVEREPRVQRGRHMDSVFAEERAGLERCSWRWVEGQLDG